MASLQIGNVVWFNNSPETKSFVEHTNLSGLCMIKGPFVVRTVAKAPHAGKRPARFGQTITLHHDHADPDIGRVVFTYDGWTSEESSRSFGVLRPVEFNASLFLQGPQEPTIEWIKANCF